MTGQRLDYSSERQRHEKFVGRVELLARLDQLLVDGSGDRWVVVTGETRMTRDDLLTRLSNLLPSQFKEVLIRAKVPTTHLPAESAPQATRAIDAIHYLEQQHQLDRLAQILDEIAVPS